MLPPIVKRKNNKLYQPGADEDITDRLRETSEKDLYIFSKAVMGMYDFTPHLHRPLCDWLQGNKLRKRVMLIPRSCFKTSMARCLAMHMTIQRATSNPYFPGRDGFNLRILFAAETERRALSRIGWIRRQYANNELLRLLWPDLVWEKPKVQAETWVASHFSLKRTEDYPEATFEAAGVDSGSTGSHYDVTIKDDLIGLRSRKMPELIPASIEWFQTSHSLSDNLRTYMDYVFGTRWAGYDLYSWIEENESRYEWCLKQIINDRFEESSIIFPERFTLDDIMDLKKKQGDLFWLNYMNKAIGATTAFDMQKAMYCHVDMESMTLDYDEDQRTRQILDVIETANKPKEKPKIKKFWEMTPEERTQQWLDMQRRWARDKEMKLEIL